MNGSRVSRLDNWVGFSKKWWNLPLCLLLIPIGGVSVICAVGAWGDGRWPLFALLAVVALACALALAPAVIAETYVYLCLAFLLLSSPLLLFPRTRNWWKRTWTRLFN